MPPLTLAPVLPILIASLVLGSAPAPALRVVSPPHTSRQATSGWPLFPQPAVVNGYSPPSARWGAGHRGIDLSATPGQVVRAPREGELAFAGTVAGAPVVSIDHPDGTRSTYQPVATTLSLGAELSAGQPFALVVPGASHCTPALCLHWGVRRGRDYLDPLTMVTVRPIRLLPLTGH